MTDSRPSTASDLARDLGRTPRQVRALLRARGLGVGPGGRYRWTADEYAAVRAALGGPAVDGGTVDAADVEAFSAMADRWWDQDGPFRMLHRVNPARLAYLRTGLVAHYGRDGDREQPLDGLRIADIGCGGGLVAEPLARLGADVTGLDASAEAVAAAARHAAAAGLDIAYRTGAVESLAAEAPGYDALVALEIIEHVSDRQAFVKACCACVRPGGVIILSTLNRTVQALALGIVGAEYVLRWVPRGTHQWSKFVRPSELARDLRRSGARLADVTGLAWHPLDNRWRLGSDISVNYLARAVVDP